MPHAARYAVRTGLVIAGSMLMTTGAMAQDTPFGNLSGSKHDTSAQDTRVEQIAPTATDDRETKMPESLQVMAIQGDTEPVSQLSSVDRNAAPSPQLSSDAPSAEASAALSSRREGRPEAVAHLPGDDRCDPAIGEARGKAVCANAIETRAAEFTRPDPTRLTPEQRLLIAQRAQEITAGADAAVRRIGRNAIDPDDAAAQGLASIVLPAPTQTAPPPEKSEPEDIPTDTPALDILQAVTQLQQNP